MHRARHSGASSSPRHVSVSSTLRRPRALILLVVAGVGLAAALWLPTRNDSASATENGWDRGQAQNQDGDHSHWWSWDRDRNRDRDGDRDRDRNRDGRRDRDRQADPSESPSESPSSSPSPSESATASPSPSASDSTPPSQSPAPDVSPWKPFTVFTAGQLVKFRGVEYQVQETHTSLPGWEPPKLPLLFKVL
jgi:hypothetical protein